MTLTTKFAVCDHCKAENFYVRFKDQIDALKCYSCAREIRLTEENPPRVTIRGDQSCFYYVF